MTCLIKSDSNFPLFLFGFYLWISRIDNFTVILVRIPKVLIKDKKIGKKLIFMTVFTIIFDIMWLCFKYDSWTEASVDVLQYDMMFLKCFAIVFTIIILIFKVFFLKKIFNKRK